MGKPKEAKNTLRSRATAFLVDVLGEGQIEVIGGDKGVFLEKTAIEGASKKNYSGVKTTFRTGTKNQNYIPGNKAATNEINIGTQLTVLSGDIVRTIVDTSADAFIAKIRIGSLSLTNSKNGDIKPSKVVVSVWRKNNGGSYTKVHTFTVKGKTNTPYEVAKRIDLPAGTGPWDIKFVRETPDSDNSYLRNETYVTSYTLVYDAKLAYPYTAHVGLEIDAKKYGSVFPDRRYRMRRTNAPYPSNWNPTTRVYTGVWDGTFLTGTHDNPAWYLWELMTNDIFGLGDLISATGINKWNLYTIAQYCDGLINGKPRFTLNVQVMTRVKALQLLDTISSVFRGMIYWSAGAIDFAQDAPASAIIDVTAANTIDGIFNRIGSARKARHSSVTVGWNNPALLGDVDYVRVDRDDLRTKFGDRSKEIGAFGCTDEDEARRVGEWVLETEANEKDVITWKASLDHLNVVPGKRARIFDSAYQGARFSGRILGIVDNYFTLVNDFTSASWNKTNVTVTSNAIVNWNGDLTADKIVETAVSGAHVIGRTISTVVAGERITISYMIKAAERTRVRVQMGDNTASAVSLDVNLTTGEIISSSVGGVGFSNAAYKIVNYGNGWFYCSISATKVDADPDVAAYVFGMIGTSNSYLGVAGEGFYLSHGQWERADAPTIPTDFSAVLIDDPSGVSLASAELNTMKQTGIPQTHTVQKYTDGGTYVHTTARFTDLPQLMSIWSLTSPSITGELVTVTGIFEKGKNIFEVQAVKHDPTKYARIERGVTITHPAYSVIPSGQLSPPEMLDIDEYFVDNNGVFEPYLMISWLQSQDARTTAYEYQYAETGDDFNEPVRLDTLSIDLAGVSEGMFTFQVRSVAAPGVPAAPSEWVAMEVLVVGANKKPADVTGLLINVVENVATLKWTMNVDALTNNYEIRHSPLTTGATWAGGVVVADNISRTTVKIALESRIGTYMIKAKSKNNVYSASMASIVNYTNANNSQFFGTVDESADWFGLTDQNIAIRGTAFNDSTYWTLTNLTAASPANPRETAVNGLHQMVSKYHSMHAIDHVKYRYVVSSSGVGGRNARIKIADEDGNYALFELNTTTFAIVSSSIVGFTGLTTSFTNVGSGFGEFLAEFDTVETSESLQVTINMLNGTSDTYLGVVTNGLNHSFHTIYVVNKQMIENGSGYLELAPATDYRVDGYYTFANSASLSTYDPSIDLTKKTYIKFKPKFVYTVTDDGGVIGDLVSIGDSDALGGNNDGITITPQVRSTDYVGLILDPGVYGDWQNLTDALFIGRAFQFRFLVHSENPLITPIIESAVIEWEVPQYAEGVAGIVANAGTFTQITFDKEFCDIPSIQVTPRDLASGHYIEVSAQTTTGFRVRIYNAGGTIIAKTFDWFATGYGPVIP